MSEPFIGEIIMFAGNFAPRGWALCQGQILSIAQNTALFSILGTTYGGNGQTTFALPDLRGRAPVGQGQGPGLPATTLGEQAGTPTTTLIANNIPPLPANLTVAGTLACSNEDATNARPNGNVPATATQGFAYINASDGSKTLAGSVTGTATGTIATGGPQPFSIQSPYLCINFIIALEGIFPSRN
jgi:microcystin-dependent protein